MLEHYFKNVIEIAPRFTNSRRQRDLLIITIICVWIKSQSSIHPLNLEIN